MGAGQPKTGIDSLHLTFTPHHLLNVFLTFGT
jgi:hypothetical protein